MRLVDVCYRAGSELWLKDINLSLAPGAVNVLLGATRAGKTTLLRVMAGLERPASGKVFAGARDVTGEPVGSRSVAMVHQQFINYPSLTVFENIASPLRVARKSAAEIATRVGALAELLRISPYLSRRPAELSGGQQQRTALARALARDADLLLLDEPLVNLDYKLREELRIEFSRLFAESRTTIVYATTEPQEALQLGGRTGVLREGRLLQFGATTAVFRRPQTLAAARAFSDPPLNVLPATFDAATGATRLADGFELILPPAAARLVRDRTFNFAVRAHDISLTRSAPHQIAVAGRVELAEISGSETYVHLAGPGFSLMAQASGVHELALNEPCTLYFDPADCYGFGIEGELLFAPEWIDGAN